MSDDFNIILYFDDYVSEKSHIVTEFIRIIYDNDFHCTIA